MTISLIFIFGLIIGSFLNCLIFRIHSGESMLGRSKCPLCQKIISWYDNIPVFSFLILKGQCRRCLKKISCQYPIIELATAILFVLAYNIFMPIAGYDLIIIGKAWFLISVMLIIFVYDLRWYEIPDSVTLPSCAIFLFTNLYLDFDWLTLLISALIGGGFFLLQFLVSQGKWIGGGDIRLGLLMGLALGKPDLLITALMIAYFIGSIAGLTLMALKKKKMSSKLPLGVFLTIGTLIVFFWGQEIINWYLDLL